MHILCLYVSHKLVLDSTGCPKNQEPIRIKLHTLNSIFIIYNICSTCSPLHTTHFVSHSIIFLLILNNIFRLTYLLNIFPLVPDFVPTLCNTPISTENLENIFHSHRILLIIRHGLYIKLVMLQTRGAWFFILTENKQHFCSKYGLPNFKLF